MNGNKLQLITEDMELASKLSERYNSFEPMTFLESSYMVESCAINLRGSGRVAEFGMAQCVPVVTEWSGEGRPPVGIKCEYRHANYTLDCWYSGEIRYISDEYVIIGTCPAGEQHYYTRNLSFRPILTEEQRAAKEREKRIDAVFEVVRHWPNESAVKSIIGKLYDAGFIKQEEKQ